MLKQKHVTIEGADFLLQTIPATKALSLQPKVMKLLGRSIAAAFSSGATTDTLEGDVLERIVNTFIDDSDKIDISQLAQDLVGAAVTYQNFAVDNPQKFNQIFSGNLLMLYKLLWEVINHNFLEQLLSGLSMKAEEKTPTE